MKHPRRIIAITGCIVALALLAGCASLSDQLDSAIQASNSAVQSAKLGVSLRTADRATDAVTSTTLRDALTELLKEENTVSQISAASGTEANHRQSTLKLIRQATDAVNIATDALSRGEKLAPAADALGTIAKKFGAAAKRSQNQGAKSQ